MTTLIRQWSLYAKKSHKNLDNYTTHLTSKLNSNTWTPNPGPKFSKFISLQILQLKTLFKIIWIIF